jgi:hypothetical protein
MYLIIKNMKYEFLAKGMEISKEIPVRKEKN